MTTIRQSKLAAHAGNHYDHLEMQTGHGGWSTRSSKRFAKKVTHRKVRRELKKDLHREIQLEEWKEVLWAVEAAKDFAARIRKASGFGAGAVSIIHGKVVVL